MKRYALEGLLTIVKSNESMICNSLNKLISLAFVELNVRNEFITEVELPDASVQKIDAGVNIRRAAYSILNCLIDSGSAGAPEILKLIDFIVAKGFDEQMEIFILANSVLGQLARKNP